MVSELHKERTEYVKKYFENYNNGRTPFKEAHIEKFQKELIKSSKKNKRIKPDLLMLYHHDQDLNLSINTKKIPPYIGVKWIEVIDSNFNEFPKVEDVEEALCRSITWRDLYERENLQKGLSGEKINTRMSLYDVLKERCTFKIMFYLVQDGSIWNCEQIDKNEDYLNFKFEDI